MARSSQRSSRSRAAIGHAGLDSAGGGSGGDGRLAKPGDGRRILQFLQQKPGAEVGQIRRELDMPLDALERQLLALEEQDLVMARLRGMRRYFAVEHAVKAPAPVGLPPILRMATPRRIVLRLLERPLSRWDDVLAATGVTAPTLRFHLARLIEDGFVKTRTLRGGTVYTAASARTLRKALTEYRPNWLDALVDAFAAAWMDIRVRAH